ncbi:OmpA family protein [Variovorax sp. YR216]|uniref:OmpA family protein n=1 Tax=Variovorax sp. YR216 TaxID=1882828 RepID=UPI000897CE25|nr:OmpA family protein [Variovorax sp. YR216]SEB09615.1 Outer membrane protein OmpA [Variovorax sp. YR216]
MIRYFTTLALAIAAALATPLVKAEKVMIYREGQLVVPQDVADVLNRSIRLLDDAPAAPAKATAVAAGSRVNASARPSESALAARYDSKDAASALSLPVRFAFDSAEILPAARTQLDALAKGIKLLAPGSIVVVEGHTDAKGSPAYNLELSRNRARAVRDYLVHEHGIDAARLKTVGYGPSQPIEATDPYAAINRRVQFRGA